MYSSDKIALFLENCISDRNLLDRINEKIDSLVLSKESGYNSKNNAKMENEPENGFFLKIASLRLRARKRYSLWKRLWFDEYTIMYSTPEYAGRYRAERLRGNTIHDLGSGSGMQAVMFSLHSLVTGVEKNRERTLMSRLNAAAYGSEAQFLNMDAFDYIVSGRIDRNDIVFSDPIRSRNNNGWSLFPQPEIVEKKLKDICTNICFDLPPRTPVDNIPPDYEAEYISFNGNIVRLTEYKGTMVGAESTAVILPEGITLSGKRKKWFPESGESGKYVCIPDPAVVSSNLLYMIKEYGEFHLGSMDQRRIVLLSQRIPALGFPGKSYEIIATGGLEDVRRTVRNIHPRQLIPRFNLPDSEYYGFVNGIMPVKSDGPPVYLYKLADRYLVTVKAII